MSEAILALESSCDETAVALVDAQGRVWAQALATQIETHRKFGGVVPEVASRDHFKVLDSLVASVVNAPEARSLRIVRVAATCGPGLVGPLLVGASYGRGLAAGWGVPFSRIHHLRGHLASALLESGPEESGSRGESLSQRAQRVFPAFVLLVSGGHSQVLEVDPRLRARARADTADDAAGECFDKSAKLMGLGYPGGPAIERLASTLPAGEQARARALASELPKPRSEQGFSFSGLKTAIRLKLEAQPVLASDPAFAWAVQETIAEALVRGLERAWAKHPTSARNLVFCGGVSANRRLRECVGAWAASHGLSLQVPPLRYCTDNAAMIAAAAWVQDPSLELSGIEARIPLDLSDSTA